MQDPFLLYATEEYSKVHAQKTIPFPKMLIMQASSYCNFSCLQCPRQIKVPRRDITGLGNGYLDLELLQKLAAEFAQEESFLGVLFALYGEPLMNKNISEMVKIVKNAGKKVQVTTNALLLDEEKALELILSGIDKIKISFQGTTEEEYAFWRNNSHYVKIKQHIETLVSLRNRLNKNLFIQVGTSVANDTPEDIEAFMSYWRDVVDNVYYDYTGMLHIQDRAYVKGKKFRYQAVKRTEPCFDIFTRMSVLYNGQVPLCVDDEEYCLGNLYEQSIREVWHCEQFKNNRKTILREGNVLPPCKFCYTSPRNIVE